MQCIFGALFLGITSVALILFIFEWENGSEALLEAHKTTSGESLMLTTPKSIGSQILTGLAEFNPLGVMLIVILVSLMLMAVGCWSVAQWYYVSPVRNVIRHIRSKRQGRAEDKINGDKQFDTDEILREFNILYDALANSQNDLNQAQVQLERKVWQRTKQFYHDIRSLEKKAKTDCLTGLANRGLLDEQLGVFFQQAQTTDKDLACLMIDIDHFKNVNDTLGHSVGDQLIFFVGELLQAFTRKDDLAARYGGDEFLILLSDRTEDQARAIAERIRKVFSKEAHRFTAEGFENQKGTSIVKVQKNNGPPPKLSIGLATVKLNKPNTAEELLQMADASLYKAKQAGRDCVASY
ncbi:MAG: GGDEF domain-containing protein [Planctomycetes bacterium]|nr:GGDEF domain-containing protein [Planctomycetota bacterium]